MPYKFNIFTSQLDLVGTGGGGSGITTLNGDTGSATGSTVTIAGGTGGIDTSATGSTVTISFDITETDIADTYAADSGTATPSANTINFVGAGTVTTSATGSTVTITGSGGSGFTWNEVTGTTQSAAVQNGYVTNNAALVTVTLPASSAVGDVIRVAGKGAGGWTIDYSTGQSIIFGSSTSTTTTGDLSSTNQYDVVELLCTVANTTWTVLSSIGNITVN